MFSRIQGSGVRKWFILSFWTRLIESMPPATTTGAPSTMTCLAAVAIAIIPDEHCRSIVIPETSTGMPARIAHCRATLLPWEPCCMAQPITTSSTSPFSTPARSTAAAIAAAPMVGDSRLLKAPR